MKLARRRFLHLAVGTAALPAAARSAWAQTYPSRPVRIVVGFAAGGSLDTLARLIGQWLSERLGQPFLIENRTGASSNIATEAVVRAPADGNTLLMCGTVNAVNATLYDKLNFIFLRDIAPVAGFIRVPQVLDVHPSVPARTAGEFIAYAKANPGKLNMGSGGIGTPQHVAGELFKMMTGVDMVHVPYRGGAPAVADLLGGQVQVMFDVMPESSGQAALIGRHHGDAFLRPAGKRHADCRLARRLRQAHRRGHRKVGQSDPCRQPQSGLRRRAETNDPIKSREQAPPHPCPPYALT
jgi:tripartite-type tricarboxylate transporter receptor subunit TctC